MPFISLVRTNDGSFYMLVNDREHCIQGFDTVQDGLAYYEDAYHRKHTSGYEQSMSACINWLFYQPSILHIENDTDTLSSMLELDGDGKPQVHNLWCIAGGMTGLLCKPEVSILWDAGTKPQLIDPDLMSRIALKDAKATVALLERRMAAGVKDDELMEEKP